MGLQGLSYMDRRVDVFAFCPFFLLSIVLLFKVARGKGMGIFDLYVAKSPNFAFLFCYTQSLRSLSLSLLLCRPSMGRVVRLPTDRTMVGEEAEEIWIRDGQQREEGKTKTSTPNER